MNIEKGIALIKEFEGCSFVEYQDSGGVPTIGYGHTRGVVPGAVCTQAQAENWLEEDCKETLTLMLRHVRVFLTDNQVSALLSFTYNEGPGHLAGSTLLSKLNAGDLQGCADEFPKWDLCRGQKVAGLERRRLAERALFLTRSTQGA